MSRSSLQEIEVKLPLPSVGDGRRRLRAAGFRLRRARVFELNVLFDTPEGRLRQQRQLLRLRQAGSRVAFTYKGEPVPGPHKQREELEVRVSDYATCALILEKLGFVPGFRYEKYRTEYALRGQYGLATIDETPIGIFLELEGPGSWIDRTAAALGFTPEDYITASYGRLYLNYCERLGLVPGDMVFAREPSVIRP